MVVRGFLAFVWLNICKLAIYFSFQRSLSVKLIPKYQPHTQAAPVLALGADGLDPHEAHQGNSDDEAQDDHGGTEEDDRG